MNFRAKFECWSEGTLRDCCDVVLPHFLKALLAFCSLETTFLCLDLESKKMRVDLSRQA